MIDNLKNGGEQQPRRARQSRSDKCPPQTFPGFTSECIQALRAKVQSVGIDPSEAGGEKTSGEASRAGFRIRWRYDQNSQELTVQCIASPFYAPCKVVTAQIEAWVRACYPSPAAELSNETTHGGERDIIAPSNRKDH